MPTRSSRRLTKMAAAGLVSFALIAAACGGDDGDDDASSGTDAPAETEAPTGTDADTDAPAETDAPADTGVEEGEIETEDVVEEAEAGPVAGGTLRYGLEADVDGINPTSSALSSPGLMMGNTVFDTLAAWDADGVAVPYLAESIEPVDGNFAVWQVKLRTLEDGSNILFHDGTPLNADAVIKNFETQRNDPLVGLALRPFYPETGAVEKIDDLTVQFNLLEPNAFLTGGFASQLGMVASPAWLDAALADPALNQEPVGTGPFVFDSRSADSVTRFVRNDDWWNGEVYLDAVEYLPDTDPDSRADRLFGGEIQALQTSNPATVGDLLDDDSIQNVIDETGEESFVMINSAAPPFDDVRARRALTLATPRQNFDTLIGLGISRQADQRFIPESKYFNPTVVQEGDLPDEAVALAGEYCADRGAETNPITGGTTCSDGQINMELQWSGPSVIQTRIAELLDEGWSAAFNVTFDEKPQDEHIQEAALGLYNTVTWRQFGAVDPALDNVWLMCRTIGGISLNWPQLCDEERDALLLQAQATEDEAERIALYQQISEKMNQDYVYIFTQHTIWDNAFAEEVRGQCERTSPEGVLLRCAVGGRTWPTTVWFAE